MAAKMPEHREALVKAVITGKGAALATEAWGEPAKGTILLIMGATASMVWWPDALMRELAGGGYRAIRFDHRDTGRSTTNPPGDLRYDLFDLADDIIAVLDAYAVDQAHLVGMSLGGLLAQIVALGDTGRRIASLTLIASEPLGMSYNGEGIDPKFMDHFSTMDQLDWSDQSAVSDYLLRIAELSAGSAVPFDEPAARRRVDTEIRRSNSIQSAFNHGGVSGDLDGLTVGDLDLPLLVVHGSEDPIISVAAGRAIAAAVPGASLMILDRRGHEILDQDVPAISSAVLALADGAGRR